MHAHLRPRWSRRRLLLALLQGAAIGSAAHLWMPRGAMAVPISDEPPIPDRVPAQDIVVLEPPPEPTHIVYVTAHDAPGADGTRDHPIALTRALLGGGGVITGARLTLLETEYRLPASALTTISNIEIRHIDDARVTIRLEGNWHLRGGHIRWINVTIVGA